MDSQSNEIVLLIVMLFTVVFLIYKTYQTSVTSKTFIINIYLYVLIALLFVAVMGKYTESLKITDANNMWKMTILYFISIFAGMFMIINDKFFINHIGFLLLLLALSLIIGSSYKYSTNITQAATITSIIVAILTMVVFTQSEENLIKMSDWLPKLTWILLIIILIELGYIIFFDIDKTFYKIISTSVIVLFGFFILSNTSKLLIDSKKIECKTHDCINYPLRSINLVTNYVNIFVGLLDHK